MNCELHTDTFEARLSEIRRSLWEIEGALRYGHAWRQRRADLVRAAGKLRLSVLAGETDQGGEGRR